MDSYYFRFIYNLFHEIPFLTFFIFITSCYSQKKVLQTKFTTDNITIDGKLDEPIWQSTPEATNFIMSQPDNAANSRK
jgi:hypothetical protein